MGRPPFWHESGEGERQNGPWIGKETMAQCTVHEVFCFTLMLHKVNRHGHCIIHSSTRKHPMVLGHSCAIFEGEISQWMPPIECFFFTHDNGPAWSNIGGFTQSFQTVWYINHMRMSVVRFTVLRAYMRSFFYRGWFRIRRWWWGRPRWWTCPTQDGCQKTFINPSSALTHDT